MKSISQMMKQYENEMFWIKLSTLVGKIAKNTLLKFDCPAQIFVINYSNHFIPRYIISCNSSAIKIIRVLSTMRNFGNQNITVIVTIHDNVPFDSGIKRVSFGLLTMRFFLSYVQQSCNLHRDHVKAVILPKAKL